MADLLFDELEHSLEVSGQAHVLIAGDWLEVITLGGVRGDDTLAQVQLSNHDRVVFRKSSLVAIRLSATRKKSTAEFYENI